MQTLILSLHVVVCVALVILVLLQSGKEGMGVIFGGGNSSVFGSTGAGGLLAKITAFMALLFVVTSLGFNIMNSTGKAKESTILDVQLENKPAAAAPAPVKAEQPAAVTPAPAAQSTAAEKTEAPKTEAPKTDAAQPATPAAPAQQPAAETPKADAPKTESAPAAPVTK